LHRRIQGEPTYHPAPVCPACHIVHISGCPEARPKDPRVRVQIKADVTPTFKAHVREAAAEDGMTVSELVAHCVAVITDWDREGDAPFDMRWVEGGD
jgi:hypothetical protein